MNVQLGYNFIIARQDDVCEVGWAPSRMNGGIILARDAANAIGVDGDCDEWRN